MDISLWLAILKVQEVPFFSLFTNLDLPNQRVINSDVDRTRTGVLTMKEKGQMEMLLTYYCKEFNTSYKQGMNEIVAPFLLMARHGLPLHMVYLLFKTFLHKYLPTMFADQNFKPLQAMFLLFRLILRYIDPRLSTFFLVNHIEPQLFLTPWLLTLYAGKINDLQTLYLLWEEIINEDDMMFPLFISLAVIMHYKEDLFLSADKIIPQVISHISLNDQSEMVKIIAEARGIKNNLPYSILIKIAHCGVFDLEKIDALIESLEKEACLALLSCEVVHRAYPEIDICPCNSANCPWKTERGHNIPLVIIDCRPESEQCVGIFPNSILLSPQAYIDTDYMMNFPDQFMPMRNMYHFCLMSSEKYKGLDFNLAVSGEGSKQQNLMENLIQAFLMKGFKFLSVLEGGFRACHDFAMQFNITLENHDKNYCKPCVSIEKHKVSQCIPVKPHPQNIHKSLEVNQKELVETSLPATEKFLFFCYRYENGICGKEEHTINVSAFWFKVSKITAEIVQEIFRLKISGLMKITFIKKNPKVISFKFSEHPDDLLFMMRSVEEAKLCVNGITRYFQSSLPSFDQSA